MKTEQEILDKWRPVVDYSSKHIEETPEELKQYVSNKLEEWEEKCLEWASSGKINDNALFPSAFIPQVRSTLGNPIIEEDVLIDGKLGLVIENGRAWGDYFGKIGIVYKEEQGIHCHIPIMGVYKFVNDEWEYDEWEWEYC